MRKQRTLFFKSHTQKDVYGRKGNIEGIQESGFNFDFYLFHIQFSALSERTKLPKIDGAVHARKLWFGFLLPIIAINNLVVPLQTGSVLR